MLITTLLFCVLWTWWEQWPRGFFLLTVSPVLPQGPTCSRIWLNFWRMINDFLSLIMCSGPSISFVLVMITGRCLDSLLKSQFHEGYNGASLDPPRNGPASPSDLQQPSRSLHSPSTSAHPGPSWSSGGHGHPWETLKIWRSCWNKSLAELRKTAGVLQR